MKFDGEGTAVNEAARVFPFCAEANKVFLKNIFGPEQEEKLMEIVTSLERSEGWEAEGETGMIRGNSDGPGQSIKGRKAHTEDDQALAEDATLTAQSELNGLLEQLEPKQPIPKEQTSQTEQGSSLPLYVSDLIGQTKHQLASLKTFASYARDKFRDTELGKRYQKTLLERINETTSLLDSYADYLRLSNPIRKTNTIHTLIEETLTECQPQLKAREVAIIKKQFQKDLPETTLPEAQLRDILQTLMHYITRTIPVHGTLGLLTRLANSRGEDEDGKGQTKEDGKSIEVLLAFDHPDKETDRFPSLQNRKGMGFLLLLVREILKKNNGVLEVKPSNKHAMTLISLMLPVERKTVFQFPPSTFVQKMSQAVHSGNDGQRQAGS